MYKAVLDVQQVHHRHGTGLRAFPKQGQERIAGGFFQLLARRALRQCLGQSVLDALLAFLDQIAGVAAGDAVHLDLHVAGNGLLAAGNRSRDDGEALDDGVDDGDGGVARDEAQAVLDERAHVRPGCGRARGPPQSSTPLT